MTGPGTTIAGRYRVLHQLGMGGMGSVWLARDTSLDRHVAVKSVRASLGSDGTGGSDGLDGSAGTGPSMGEQRAMREARLIARVNHSHAVAIYDVVTHEQQPWLVMEYVPSRNLSELVRQRGELEPERTAEIGAQVASALVDAHRAGIVHRDVKPANVLIAEDGSAKITDFGIARGLDDVTLTATGAMWGTPAYFAPEVASGSAPTEKADVWSLGATLYFAVEGAPPYGTDGGALVLLGRIAHQPVPPSTRAGSLSSVLARLLDRDPHTRPSMAEAAQLLGARRPWHDDTRVIGGFGPPAYGDEPIDDPATADTPTPDSPRILPPTTPGGSLLRSGGPGRPRRPSLPSRSGRAPVLAMLALAVVVAVAGLLWLAGSDGEQQAADEPKPAQTPAAGGPRESPSERQPTQSPSDSGNEGRPQPPRTEKPQKPEKPEKPKRSKPRGAAFTSSAMTRSVADYYAIMPRDTRTGFTLLGPSLRSQGFSSYDDFWDSIDSVDVRDLRASPSSHTVDGTVVFVSKDGSTSTEHHRFGLVKDGSGDHLLINTDDLLG